MKGGILLSFGGSWYFTAYDNQLVRINFVPTICRTLLLVPGATHMDKAC